MSAEHQRQEVRELLQPEGWDAPQRILVVLAHPDDPEFFCGATLARWIDAGHLVSYCLLTCGDKGTHDRQMSAEKLCRIRHEEQERAADFLGVSKVRFLDFPDGYLVADLKLRKAITRVIREERPDVVLTCDPQLLFVGDERINHPDHRAAGQACIDAVFPAARAHLYFPELLEEGLEPHTVRELWVSLPVEPNVFLDVTPLWERKIEAILCHKSQIVDEMALRERMKNRLARGSTPEHPRYEEAFRRIYLSQR
ncbi:MAG: PIG-L deacetylase family protein [Anaerolineales bacterium]|nr:PIG-L family deacetylase [Anaerolineales bacterium]MCS7248513.1 PIG-L family deacetylase [Anaerolineales bacterium]MDW8162326.1 PIG-L deacetylase family protein [Anaerolineales bacterium]MDW8446590.1 PIG-L deacetylase family protein [Anaerolineales bacterium]